MMYAPKSIGFKSWIATMAYGYFWVIIPLFLVCTVVILSFYNIDNQPLSKYLRGIASIVFILFLGFLLLRNFIYRATVNPQKGVILLTLVGNRKVEKKLDTLEIVLAGRLRMYFSGKKYTPLWYDIEEILGALPKDTPIAFKGFGSGHYKSSLKRRGIDDPRKLLGTAYDPQQD